jgi:uncharacterized repeat protein (TIGR01451 family)
MRKKVAFLTLIVVLALAIPVLVLAQGSWSEDFDAYAAGDDLQGVGGWKGWDNDPTFSAVVTDTFSHSAPNSVDINGLSDLVREFTGYDSGSYRITAWQFIPDGFVGQSYYIWLNQYADGGPYNWSVQVQFDSGTATVISEDEGNSLPYVVEEWVEIFIDVDLDNDTQSIYYDDQLLSTKSWIDGVSGGGTATIGAIDLFANGATSVFYDDISVKQFYGLEVTKTPETQTIVTGGTVSWTIDLTNMGVMSLTNVTAVDPMAADCDMQIGDMLAGDTFSYDCELTGVTESFTNTITVTGDAIGASTIVTETAEAYVEVVPPTSVSLSGFGGSDSGSTWVLVLAAGVIGVGVVLVLSRRRRIA